MINYRFLYIPYLVGPINYGPPFPRNSILVLPSDSVYLGLYRWSLIIKPKFNKNTTQLLILTIIISLAIRQCAAWSSTLITHNFPEERRKPQLLLLRLPSNNFQCAAWASTLIAQKNPEGRNPQEQRKPMHMVYLPSMSTPLHTLSTILYFLLFLLPPPS